MKWFKHISDSLDDPLIYDLITEFGSDGYLVFFGVLEKYSREFSPENGWKLVINPSFFRQKFLISSRKIENILLKITTWEVEYKDGKVSIYIPKFTTLLDEWSRRKLGSHSGETPKILKTDKDTDKDTDKEKHNKRPIRVYSDAFENFWKAYPKHSCSKKAAYRQWEKATTKPSLEIILSAIKNQKRAKAQAKDAGQFVPEWPDAERWISKERWEDETDEPEGDLDSWARRKQAELDQEKTNGTV